MIKESVTLNKILVSGYVQGTVYFSELKPSTMSYTVKNIAELIEAVDGTVNYMHRNYKGSWSTSWQLIPKSFNVPVAINTVDQLREIYQSVQYTNTALWICFQNTQTGVISSTQIIPEPNSYSEELAATQVSLTNKPLYNVSMRFIEV
jgi:hypothetical protein